MEDLRVPHLVDEHGQPLSSRVEGVLRGFIPKLRREFPALQDEQEFAEILERAGQKIERRERRQGLLERLHPYAWVTIKSVAQSWMRRASSRLAQKTLAPEAAEELLASVPAREGSREAIEQAVLWREALDRLTPDERLVCRLKIEGYSSEYIARIRGSSTAAVDMVFSRAKQKLHRFLADAQSASSQQKPAAGENVTPRPSPLHAAVVKKPDGERTPGA